MGTPETNAAMAKAREQVQAKAAADAEQAKKTDPRLRAAEELIAACEAELATSPDRLRAARLNYEVARLLETPLGDHKAAAERYQRAHALNPEHIPAMQGARRALIANKSHQAALPLFDSEIRVTADSARKARLYYEKGRLLQDHLAQKREAREAFAAGLELDEGNATLLRALERAEQQAGAWAALDKTFERAAEAVTGDGHHRATLVAERARLVEAHKGDVQTATELYKRAIEIDPRAPGALEALKRLLYAQNRHKDLIDALGLEAEQASEPEARAMAYYRIARLQVDRLGDAKAAIAPMERAAQEAPSDRTIAEELARLYERAKQPDKLAASLERLVSLSKSPAEQAGLMHRIGQIYQEDLADLETAVVWYQRELEREPSYLPGLQALGGLYEQRGDWQQLIAMHLGEAENSQQPERRASAFARVAEIYERKLEQPDQAAQHHARALGIVPGYAPSFKALVRLYIQATQWRKLIELYERAVDQASDAETKLTYLFKIGRLYEDSLDSPAQAVAAYRRVLDHDATNMAAIHSMQRAAEHGALWKDLVDALELEAGHTRDKQASLPLLHRAGEVLEQQLGDDDAALERYRKVVNLDPAYAPVLASLGRLYYRAGRWEDLLDTYRKELKTTEKGTPSASLLYKMGELCERKMARDDDAVAFYRQAMDHDALHRPSIAALARKLNDRAQWPDLVRLLELELSAMKDAGERARTAFRAGEVYENHIGQPDKALAAYDKALAAAPGFRPAIDGRARLLAQKKDWKKLVEELERQAEASPDKQAAVAALYTQGEVWRDELKEKPRAVEAFQAVLERDPEHLGALFALEQLYADLGQWEALGKIYGTLSRVLSDDASRIAALLELGRMQAARGIGTPEAIRQTYFAVLQIDPAEPLALAELERIALAEGDAQLLAHVDAKLGAAGGEDSSSAAHHTRLAEMLEAAGDASALEVYRSALKRDPENVAAARGLSRLARRSNDAALLEEAAEREASVIRDLDAAAEALCGSAELRATAGNLDGAVSALERALVLHPDHAEAAGRLHELLGQSGKVDALLDALSRAAQAAKQPDRRAALWISVAELQADRKNDVPAALASLKRVRDEQPTHLPMLMKLSELYMRDRQWSEAVERLKQVLAQSPPESVLKEVHLRLAEVLHEHLDDADRALKSLEAVLAIDENDPQALVRLLDIQLSRQQTEKAAATAGKLVRAAKDLDSKAMALSHQGRLERARGNTQAAIEALEQAVTLAGMAGNAASEFRAMLEEREQKNQNAAWGNYAAALSRHLEQTSRDAKSLAPVHLEIGRVLYDKLGQHDQGLAALRRGIDATPGNPELRAELAGRLKHARHFQQAVDELRRLLDLDPMRADTWRDLSESFKGLGRSAESTLTLAPLVALGHANDLEKATLATRPAMTGRAHPGSLDPATMRSFDALGAQDAAEDLLAAISDGLGKVYPPELERFGVSSKDRLAARSGHPLRALADQIAQVYGGVDYDLYVHRAHSGAIQVELSDPPGVMVPAYILNLSEAQQVFLLARPLANAARKLHAVHKLKPDAIGVLLAAAARNVDGGFGAGLADDETLNGLARRVVKSLPWGRKGRMEEAAERYLAAPRRGFGDWVLGVRMTATRAGLLIADDLPACVTLMRRTEGDQASIEGPELAHGIALVHDALRFWVSDAAFALRHRMGIL